MGRNAAAAADGGGAASSSQSQPLGSSQTAALPMAGVRNAVRRVLSPRVRDPCHPPRADGRRC
eukprot:4833601-Alexandrium_andersonii.AAC.1